MSWLGPNEFGRGGDYEGGGQQEEDQVHGRGGQQDGRGGQMFPVGSQRDLTHSLLGAAMPLMDCKYVQLLKQTHIWVPHFIFDRTCVANLPNSTFPVTTRWNPLTLLEFTLLHTTRYLYVGDRVSAIKHPVNVASIWFTKSNDNFHSERIERREPFDPEEESSTRCREVVLSSFWQITILTSSAYQFQCNVRHKYNYNSSNKLTCESNTCPTLLILTQLCCKSTQLYVSNSDHFHPWLVTTLWYLLTLPEFTRFQQIHTTNKNIFGGDPNVF